MLNRLVHTKMTNNKEEIDETYELIDKIEQGWKDRSFPEGRSWITHKTKSAVFEKMTSDRWCRVCVYLDEFDILSRHERKLEALGWKYDGKCYMSEVAREINEEHYVYCKIEEKSKESC